MTGLTRTAVGPRATVALSGHPVTTALPDFELRGGLGESAFEDQSLLKNHRFESKDDTETLSARESNKSRCLAALCISAFLIRPHTLKIGDGTFLSSFSCSLVVEDIWNTQCCLSGLSLIVETRLNLPTHFFLCSRL